MTRHALLALPLLLGACAGTDTPVPPGPRLSLPSARLMEPTARLASVAKGADLYEENLVCRGQYGALADKVDGLQNYARVITKTKPPKKEAAP